jgi:uncharacterized membrane protein
MFNPIRMLAARPRLVAGFVFGALVAVALHFKPGGVAWSTQAILSWDAGCLFFIVSMMLGMANQSVEAIQQRSSEQDEGQGVILALVLVAAIASVGAVAAELSIAKALHGFAKTLRVALAFGTVAISWFLVQLIFALHYAHEYYSSREGGAPGEIERGLGFPNGEMPDYWDFLHFSVVIGVASQTADIGFTSKILRRIGTVHGLIAFMFNTVVLALGINLVAGLF